MPESEEPNKEISMSVVLQMISNQERMRYARKMKKKSTWIQWRIKLYTTIIVVHAENWEYWHTISSFGIFSKENLHPTYLLQAIEGRSTRESLHCLPAQRCQQGRSWHALREPQHLQRKKDLIRIHCRRFSSSFPRRNISISNHYHSYLRLRELK